MLLDLCFTHGAKNWKSALWAMRHPWAVSTGGLTFKLRSNSWYLRHSLVESYVLVGMTCLTRCVFIVPSWLECFYVIVIHLNSPEGWVILTWLRFGHTSRKIQFPDILVAFGFISTAVQQIAVQSTPTIKLGIRKAHNMPRVQMIELYICHAALPIVSPSLCLLSHFLANNGNGRFPVVSSP